jgi:hypothetical protein
MADEEQRKKNVRLALILASIAIVFFVGFIARQVLLSR